MRASWARKARRNVGRRRGVRSRACLSLAWVSSRMDDNTEGRLSRLVMTGRD